MSDTVVVNFDKGPAVLLRTKGDRTFVVIQDKRGHYLQVSPSFAAQIATGIDLALERVTRDGRIGPPRQEEFPF